MREGSGELERMQQELASLRRQVADLDAAEQVRLRAEKERRSALSEIPRTKQAHLESEERFRSFVEQTSDGMILTDEQGVIIEWNRAEEHISGFPREQALGRPIWEILYAMAPEERGISLPIEAFKQAVIKACRTGEATWFGRLEERWIGRPNGTRRLVETMSFPIPTGNGYRIGSIARDITERKWTEAALQTSEEKYRNIVERIPMGMLMYQLEPDEQLVLVAANPAADEILGMAMAPNVGRRIEEIFPGLIGTEVPERYRLAAAHGEPWHHGEFPYEGNDVSGIFELHAFQTSPGRMVATFADITARKQVENALQQSEDRYRQIINNASDIIFTADHKGYLTFVNPVAARIMGLDADQLVGRQYLDFVRDDWREEAARFYRRQFDKRINNTYFELPAIAADGTQIWLGQNVHLVMQGERVAGFQAVLREITERVQAEKQVRRRNRELAALYEILQTITSSLDRQEILDLITHHATLLLNASATTLLLYDATRQDIWFAAGCGEDSEKLLGQRLALGQGIAGWVVEHGEPALVVDAARDQRWFGGFDETLTFTTRSVVCVPMQTKGKTVGAIEVVNKHDGPFHQEDLDLLSALAAPAATAIENAWLFAQEEQRASELSRALEQQRELSRLKNEFMQSVSHELRTPLAITLGYAEMLANGELGQLQPEQKDPVNIIARRTRMLADLVSDVTSLLDDERRVPGRELVDVGKLVYTQLADFGKAAQDAGLCLTVDVEPNLPLVLGNTTRLRRVVDNLLDNAFKFTAPLASHIDASAESGARIDVRVSREGDGLALEVVDTGIGIGAEHQERIFERFFQVDGSSTRRFGGSGLGLALVREIVEAHGGHVSVASAVGVGSTFTVWLPQYETNHMP